MSGMLRPPEEDQVEPKKSNDTSTGDRHTQGTFSNGDLACPSARPDMAGAIAFGVIGGTIDHPRVNYLSELEPVSVDLLALADPLAPTEVFRFAAPCAASQCRHFDGAACRLASRVVSLLPETGDRLPACRIRPSCRWWRQEGPAACRRCPQIVSTTVHPDDRQRSVAQS